MVQTYGTEMLESQNYTKYLAKSDDAQRKMANNFSLGLAALFLTIFWFYGYALYFGANLRVNETEIRPGETYTAGVIISVMSCVIIGSFALGGASSNWKIVTEARVAGKMANDTISH